MSLSNDKALKSVAEAVNKIMEAEKKAKMDYDKDGKIESPKDEVWGSRLRAAKMAGKLKEEEQNKEDAHERKEEAQDAMEDSPPETEAEMEQVAEVVKPEQVEGGRCSSHRTAIVPAPLQTPCRPILAKLRETS